MSKISGIPPLGALSIRPHADASCCSPAGCAATTEAAGRSSELIGVASTSQTVSVDGATELHRLRDPYRVQPGGPHLSLSDRIEGVPLYLIVASFLL